MKKDVLPDSEIVELFFRRNERALEALSDAYGAYFLGIASNVLKNREDCEQCLNDAYFALWNRIPPERPQNLRAYAAKTVRNAALKSYLQAKQNAVHASDLPLDELAECLVCPESAEGAYDALRLKALIDRFVRSLSGKERILFICRYYYCDSISSIARLLGTSEKTVYKRLAGIRAGLAEELKKEGFVC